MDDITILLIEDNAVNAELFIDVLELAHFRVLWAPDAEQGITLARKVQPRLVLMDISLPGMDGLEAIRTLRAQEKTRSLPVVCLTAHAMRGDAEKAQAAGAQGYITKPIDVREFPRQVAEHVRLHMG